MRVLVLVLVTVTAATAGLVPSVTVSAGDPPSAVDSEIEIVQAIIATAEQVRVRRVLGKELELREARSRVVVEDQEVSELMGFRFFRGHSRHENPVWIYVVALGPDGAAFRVSGFEADEYSLIVQSWLVSAESVTDREILATVAGYFEFVEEWSPGVVLSPVDVHAVGRVLANSALDPGVPMESLTTLPQVERKGLTYSVVASVFDLKASRVERVVVRLSPGHGLVVTERVAIIDRERTRQ